VVIKSQATTSLSAPTESPGPFEDTDEDGGELWSPPTACPASVEHDAALVASSPAATVVTSTCRVRTEFTIKLYWLLGHRLGATRAGRGMPGRGRGPRGSEAITI